LSSNEKAKNFEMEVLLIIWILFAIGAAMIGAGKGCGGTGFLLGLFLGPSVFSLRC